MKVVIALGSNLGDSKSVIGQAADKLGELMEVSALSSLYRTKPVGGPEQPDYVNAVLIGETEIDPTDLLAHLLQIEREAGRVRDEETVRWGPRILDLDLISYGELIMESAELMLPHPRAHERRFVLEPWSEIDPDASLPGRGKIIDILKNLAV